MAGFTLFSNPFTLAIIQRTTITLLVAFTSPSSPLRSLLFPIFIAWNAHLLPHYNEHLPRSIYIASISAENISGIYYYAEKILLRKWSFQTYAFDGGSKAHNAPKSQSESWQKIRFGAWIAFSDRYIASPYQAANTPPYSVSNPSYILSHPAFIARKLALILLSYLLVDALAEANQPELNGARYANPILTRDVGAEEFATRVGTALGYWFGAYFIVQAYFGAWQLVATVLGLSAPELERPLFGSFVGEVCTLRGFWGVFWHQMLRCRLTAIADWVTYKLLGLPRTGSRSAFARVATRYTHLLCCFLVSGLFHHAEDRAQGLKWRESGATLCFVLMGVGIVIEDAVQWVWFDVLGGGRRAEGSGYEGKRRKGTWWTMGIGYVWVALWLSFATPYYCYPLLSRNKGESRDAVVPFSVVKFLRTKYV